jgi:hypothetical protein
MMTSKDQSQALAVVTALSVASAAVLLAIVVVLVV